MSIDRLANTMVIFAAPVIPIHSVCDSPNWWESGHNDAGVCA